MGARGRGATAMPKYWAAEEKKKPGPKPKPHPWEKKGLSRAEKVIAFIETLPCTSGMLAGTNFVVRPWQREIIEAIYATDENGRRLVREVVLSFPRKNGKTGLTACLTLAHFLGPESEPRGQVYSAATKRKQAALLFEEMKAIILRVPWMRKRCNIRDFTKDIEDRETATKYYALAAEASSEFGGNTSMWIYDELAQAKNQDLYQVLKTSTGARSEPLGIVISTQSHDPNHIMSTLVDDGMKVQSGEIVDPAFYAKIYQAPEEADPWSEKTWFDCNPALGDFRSIEELRDYAEKAKRMPAMEASFRLLYLNQRVQTESSLVNRIEWVKCKSQESPLLKPSEEIFLGLDLSQVNDLSALVACSATSGERLKAWFWKPGDELAEHTRRDKVPYDLWAKDGWIEAPKGRTVDFEYIAKRIAEIWQEYKVLGLAYDRWAMKNLETDMNRIGLSYFVDGRDKPIPGALRLVPWAQTFADMSPAIAALETSLLSDKLRHDGNPVLTFCIANAVATRDAAGNRKLDKSATRYRIDGAVAAAMAIGLKAKQPAKKVPEYQFFAV